MNKVIFFFLLIVCCSCSKDANGTHRPYVISKSQQEQNSEIEETLLIPD